MRSSDVKRNALAAPQSGLLPKVSDSVSRRHPA